MHNRVSLLSVGHATSIFLALTFSFCVAWDLALPELAMYGAWQDLLPGFEWLSIKSFLFGMIEAYGYGWYFALVWVPLYNYFVTRSSFHQDAWYDMGSGRRYE